MASSQYRNTGTAGSDTSSGTLGSWNVPEFAYSTNLNFFTAYANQTNVSPESPYLLKLSSLAFSIPAEALITGITLDMNHAYSTNAAPPGSVSLQDNQIRLVKSNGTFSSVNYASYQWPENPNAGGATYGGSSDLWGETWTSTDINSSNFGAVIQPVGYVVSGPTTLYFGRVTFCAITVYYTDSVSPLPTFFRT